MPCISTGYRQSVEVAEEFEQVDSRRSSKECNGVCRPTVIYPGEGWSVKENEKQNNASTMGTLGYIGTNIDLDSHLAHSARKAGGTIVEEMVECGYNIITWGTK
jgi:hypothetical protein